MSQQMTPVARCARLSGLLAHEIILGVSLGWRHERLLAAYRDSGVRDAVWPRLVSDIRNAVRAGEPQRAADLLIVLRRWLADNARLALMSAPRRPQFLSGRKRNGARGFRTSLAGVGGIEPA